MSRFQNHVISLWQPWAALIFLDAKIHETRSWAPPEDLRGGRLYIHAAKTRKGYKMMTPRLKRLCRTIWETDAYADQVEYGGIIGYVTLAGWQPTERATVAHEEDLTCGDWSKGRWAWTLERPTKTTFWPTPGHQTIWREAPAVLSLKCKPV